MASPPSIVIAIAQRSDLEHARRVTRATALALGFAPVETESLVLAVSELASNLLRYARDGRIAITPTRDERRAGITIESLDSGPGIDDIERALMDGFSSGGGLGRGLGAVRRLMDDFAVQSSPTETRVVASKWRAIP